MRPFMWMTPTSSSISWSVNPRVVAQWSNVMAAMSVRSEPVVASVRRPQGSKRMAWSWLPT